MTGIWAVVPVKEVSGAKQRLAQRIGIAQRRILALAMMEDVIAALAAVPELAGTLVVTVDPVAAAIAARHGARLTAEGARDGHTGAVAAAARVLARDGKAGMMTVPGDIPRITVAEVQAALAAHRPAPAFTIVPAHDELGSNAVLCSPPDAVPLRFGDNSFFPHLDAARACGITPTVVRQPGIGMDIDHPADLVAFLRMSPRMPTRTQLFLEESGLAARLLAEAVTQGQG